MVKTERYLYKSDSKKLLFILSKMELNKTYSVSNLFIKIGGSFSGFNEQIDSLKRLGYIEKIKKGRVCFIKKIVVIKKCPCCGNRIFKGVN